MEIPKDLITKTKIEEANKHPQSICIANYKGGVGKTTMTCLLGYYLAKTGKKVLFIDIDAQCSLSLAVGFNLDRMAKPDFTINNLVLPAAWSKITKTNFNDYIFPVPDIHAPGTLKIIRGDFDVDELDIKIAQAVKESKKSLHELFLYCKQMIYSFNDFDFVLIDCPPNKMYLTQAMLRACTYYITVTIPDRISVFGVPRLKKWINQIEKEERPKFLGCILNGVNRSGGYETGTKNQQVAEEQLKTSIGGLMNEEEEKVIGNLPVLAHVPKLDVISKFLSQGDDKTARFEFEKSTSMQLDVDTIMLGLIKRVENRIIKYGKI